MSDDPTCGALPEGGCAHTYCQGPVRCAENPAYDDPVTERWWVCTDKLTRRGEKIIGPFESRDLALKVRRYVELAVGYRTYWVDKEQP